MEESVQAIILPIKHKYAELIYEGKKRFEFRKRVCKKDIRYIYLYETAPVSKITGRVIVKEKKQKSLDEIWNVTSDWGGITLDVYRSYYDGMDTAYVYVLGEAERFDKPEELGDYGIEHVPQSYVYIDV